MSRCDLFSLTLSESTEQAASDSNEFRNKNAEAANDHPV